MSMREYAYHELGVEGQPKNGYAIIGNTVFRVEDGRIDDSWEISEGVSNSTVQQAIAEARKVAKMPRGTRIYVDLEGEYHSELCKDCGRLLSIVDYFVEECS